MSDESKDDAIVVTDPRDIAMLRIMQGSCVNHTTLPSGFVTPARDMIVRGITLVPLPPGMVFEAGLITRKLTVRERIASPVSVRKRTDQE